MFRKCDPIAAGASQHFPQIFVASQLIKTEYKSQLSLPLKPFQSHICHPFGLNYPGCNDTASIAAVWLQMEAIMVLWKYFLKKGSVLTGWTAGTQLLSKWGPLKHQWGVSRLEIPRGITSERVTITTEPGHSLAFCCVVFNACGRLPIGKKISWQIYDSGLI